MASRKCWRCGVLANMMPVKESGARRDVGIGPGIGYTEFMACFRCDGCQALSIGVRVEHGIFDVLDIANFLIDLGQPLIWYPRDASGKTFPDVPEKIAAAASEAHTCLAVDAHRAAALLARSVVEATAKDKDVTSGQLHQKIEKMYELGLIREHIRDGAHEVRHFGNDMAHGDFVEEVTKEEAQLVLTLMDEVLEEVYQSPARVVRAQQARKAKKAQTTSVPPV